MNNQQILGIPNEKLVPEKDRAIDQNLALIGHQGRIIAELEKERDEAVREAKGSLIVLDGLKRRIRAAFEYYPDLAMFKDLSCLLNLKPSAVKLEAHNLEQQKIGIQNATAKVDTHRPFRPVSSYDGDVKIDADMWRKAYKKGYDDALVEIKHEGVKLQEQSDKTLRGE